jgi:hypothetical protein
MMALFLCSPKKCSSRRVRKIEYAKAAIPSDSNAFLCDDLKPLCALPAIFCILRARPDVLAGKNLGTQYQVSTGYHRRTESFSSDAPSKVLVE